MINKKGFTFIEILIGIALMGLVTIMLVPGIVDSFRGSKRNIMKIQEKQIANAAKIYLEDFCLNPVNDNISCSLHYDTDSEGFRVYNDTLEVSTIVDLGYISAIKLNESDCEGYIVIENTTEVNTYLYCGEEYVTSGYVGLDEITIFSFVGAEETFYAPKAGYYSIESYGAQGNGTGGKGGKVYGEIYLDSVESLSINVGGINGYNGGGTGLYSGGGASTVKYNNEIIATAAGGGGGKDGTAGGNGNAVGGAYAEGTLDLPAAGEAGLDGTNGGGGGSGNKYKDCTEYGEVYNSCLTGENTCEPGMIDGDCKTYSRCSACDCETYNTCTNVACGYQTCAVAACGNLTCQHINCGVTYSCPVEWTLSGTECTKAASTRTLWRWYYRRCTCDCIYRSYSYCSISNSYVGTGTNYINNSIYYNTTTCSSACAQKNSGSISCADGTSYNKHVSGSGTCTKIYTSWSTSSTKPSSSYNDSWYETMQETYCPTGTLSDSTCILNATSTINTCADPACGYISCQNVACGNLTCANAACGCQTYERCSSCSCEEYYQVYSPCVTGENTCEGGVTNSCIATTSDKYNSGNGGTSSVNTTVLSNTSYIHGTHIGNGKVVIKYIGAE